jgi:hypothetical protein
LAISQDSGQKLEFSLTDGKSWSFRLRRSLEVQVIPVSQLVLMVRNEFDRAILRDHNCKAFCVLAAQTIGRTMAGSGALHGLKDTMFRFNIECAINHFVLKAGDLNFNAKSQHSEFVIKQKATVDRREVRKP